MNNRALLEQPFPAELIRTRPGTRGNEVSYVPAVHYVMKLNEALDGNWSWRIASWEVRQNEVVIHGVFAAEGIERHAFGSVAITKQRETGEPVSIGDDLKAASTDALKKAASLLGLGLDLYLTEPGTVANDPANRPTTATREILPVGPPATTTVRPQLRAVAPEPVPQDRNRLTGKQLRAVYAIAHAQNMSDAALKQECKDRFGSMPEFLDRKSASALIDTLTAR